MRREYLWLNTMLLLVFCTVCTVKIGMASDLSPATNKATEVPRKVMPADDLSVVRGSPVRRAILNAVRKEIKTMHNLEVVFVVRYLRVKNGWAWTHLLPQSPDGKHRYEDISALLHLEGNVWRSKEIPCTEEDNPECITDPAYFLHLRKKFPHIPSGVLPPK